jgi:UDP-N-acetylmuramoylalanine--D-glutamate ligase
MKRQDVKDQRATVVGGARSGLAVARLLAGEGARVFLTEQSEPTEGLRASLDEAGVESEFGGHTSRALEADFFVVSPGVPSSANIVRQAARRGLGVYSEIEAASWFCDAPIVAITGSNGKTTTTSLLGHVLRTAGRDPIMAGNIGYPFSDYVCDTTGDDVVVLEISSFQLDHVETFRPRVSVLLNITPDHLDRYDHDFNKYARSKFRILRNQREGDVAVFNADDALVRDYVTDRSAGQPFEARSVSLNPQNDSSAFVRDDHIVVHQDETIMETSEVALRGQHNLYNSLAAAVAARAMEVQNDTIRESLRTFEGVPHRLELVRELDGVRYVNDSKATNVNAVWYALESFDAPVVLIAGGRDKGNDYGALKALLREKGRAVVGLGESAGKVDRELGGEARDHATAGSLEEAVSAARRFASEGDIVLLSPACASFDMFENYEDRGDTFKRLVMSL